MVKFFSTLMISAIRTSMTFMDRRVVLEVIVCQFHRNLQGNLLLFFENINETHEMYIYINFFFFSHRFTLSSQGHEVTDDEDDSTNENSAESNLFEEHYSHLAAREQLQEFSGRVPQRKRKSAPVTDLENSQQDKNKPKVRNNNEIECMKRKKVSRSTLSLSEFYCWKSKYMGNYIYTFWKYRKKKNLFYFAVEKRNCELRGEMFDIFIFTLVNYLLFYELTCGYFDYTKNVHN